MSGWVVSLQSAVRSFRRRRLFAAAAIFMLTLAIGAGSVIFTLVNAVLLKPLAFESPERLTWLTSIRPDRDDAPFNLPDYLDLRDKNRTLEQVGAMSRWSAILSGTGPTERVPGARISGNLLPLLGVRAAAGRTLLAADDQQADSRVVMISYALWTTRFGARSDLVGSTIQLDGQAYTVVGVLPREFRLPVLQEAALFAPLAADFHPWKPIRDSVNFLRIVGRVRPGVSLAQAAADLTAVEKQVAKEFPEANGRKLGVKATPLQQQFTGAIQNSLVLLLAAVMMLLLIACANLANLILTQVAGRDTELAIRAALGATRLSIVRQLTLENLLLALSGGVLAFAVTRAAVPVLIRFLPSELPRAAEVQVDARVFLFSVAASVFCAVLFGLLPALQSRSTGEALVGAARGVSSGVRSARVRDALAIAEIAVCMVLMIGTALLLRSFMRLMHTELGFATENVISTRVSLPVFRYRTTADMVRFEDAFGEHLRALPGVKSAGMVSALPLSGIISRVPFSTEARIPEHGKVPEAQFRVISPGYFRAMAMPLNAGRDFSQQDLATSEPVVVVNRTLAESFWPAGKALGSMVTFSHGNHGDRTARVVGIVGDVKQESLDEKATFDIYLPMPQMHDDAATWIAPNHFWVVRTSGTAAGLREAIVKAAAATDPDVGASDIQPLDWWVESSLSVRRFNLALIAAFGVASLLLAATGLYSVLSYSLAMRNREIGVRIALGASPAQILAMVLRQAALVIATGLGLGMLGALGLGHSISSMLFGVRTNDAVAFAATAALVSLTALAACVAPALRASRTDPIVVLRAG